MFCSKCGLENSQGANFCASCGNKLFQENQPATPQPTVQQVQGVAETIKYAGFWFRALAGTIDFVLVNFLVVIIAMPLGFTLGASMADSSTFEEIESAAEILGFFLGILIQWLWFTIAESSKWQASVGKKLLGLKVTDDQGRRLGFGQANGRYWSKLLSTLILFIGFLMIAFTEKKQGLHDKVAGTLVVRAGN
jgi:uncharacterized RDD family membrane protein YckC